MTWVLLLSSARRNTQLSVSVIYPFWSSDIPTSQSALKQSYTEKTNGQNNDDKAKSLHSAAIQFP